MSDLTSIFTDSGPVNLPPPCGIIDQCECGMCEAAYAEIIAEFGPLETPVCARCKGRGRVEVNTIAGRMLDACPDCTQPNEFF